LHSRREIVDNGASAFSLPLGFVGKSSHGGRSAGQAFLCGGGSAALLIGSFGLG